MKKTNRNFWLLTSDMGCRLTDCPNECPVIVSLANLEKTWSTLFNTRPTVFRAGTRQSQQLWLFFVAQKHFLTIHSKQYHLWRCWRTASFKPYPSLSLKKKRKWKQQWTMMGQDFEKKITNEKEHQHDLTVAKKKVESSAVA